MVNSLYSRILWQFASLLITLDFSKQKKSFIQMALFFKAPLANNSYGFLHPQCGILLPLVEPLLCLFYCMKKLQSGYGWNFLVKIKGVNGTCDYLTARCSPHGLFCGVVSACCSFMPLLGGWRWLPVLKMLLLTQPYVRLRNLFNTLQLRYEITQPFMSQ